MNKSLTEFDYAAKTRELEDLLQQLQSHDIPLDEALRLHAAGKKLVCDIENFLQHAENEVKRQVAEEK